MLMKPTYDKNVGGTIKMVILHYQRKNCTGLETKVIQPLDLGTWELSISSRGSQMEAVREEEDLGALIADFSYIGSVLSHLWEMANEK